MESPRQHASLQRRLRFADASRYALDRFAWLPPNPWLSRLAGAPLQRIPDQLVKLTYDMVESVRCAGLVPAPANPERVLPPTGPKLAQPPRHRVYWHDESRNALVGAHLGVDIVEHEGRYHVLENNLGSALKPSRRALYDTQFDPFVTGLLDLAKVHGFRQVVLLSWSWQDLYLNEFRRAAAARGLEVVVAAQPFMQPRARHRMAGLPRPLEADTMYVIHSGMISQMTYWIHDKWSSSGWINDELGRGDPTDRLLAPLPTWDTVTLPREDPGSCWPNLVVKLAGCDKASHVMIGRFDDVDQASHALGVARRGDMPRQFRAGWRDLLRRALFGRDRPIYQPFVPPALDDRGCATAIRLHLFASPLASTYLSAHLRVCDAPVPDHLATGIVEDAGPYIASTNFGGTSYAPITAGDESRLPIVADELAALLKSATQRRFHTSP